MHHRRTQSQIQFARLFPQEKPLCAELGGAWHSESALGINSVEQFTENWIWREFPAVLLITPKPEPAIVFAGSPMFTMLKILKNSERNCSTVNSDPFRRRPSGVSLISEKSKS